MKITTSWYALWDEDGKFLPNEGVLITTFHECGHTTATKTHGTQDGKGSCTIGPIPKKCPQCLGLGMPLWVYTNDRQP